jgi:hypothetical protein
MSSRDDEFAKYVGPNFNKLPLFLHHMEAKDATKITTLPMIQVNSVRSFYSIPSHLVKPISRVVDYRLEKTESAGEETKSNDIG